MKVGQVYITNKNREMEVLFVNGSGDKARCRFSDGSEADVIVEKCKDYKLVEPSKEDQKKDLIKKYKLTKPQIIAIEKWNADELDSVKNFCNTLGALARKGIAVRVKVDENRSKYILIEEAKIF